jgi:hypothetical protein
MAISLAASVARFAAAVETMDEMVHVLLKGHLLLEEVLAEIIDNHVFHREDAASARLSFAQKVHIARAVCLRKNKLGEWELVDAINSLRNDLAHRLTSPEREKKLQRVKTIYFREAAGFERIPEIKAQPDHDIVLAACAHCYGFLSACADDLKQLRGMVHAIDREMNPSEPAFDL